MRSYDRYRHLRGSGYDLTIVTVTKAEASTSRKKNKNSADANQPNSHPPATWESRKGCGQTRTPCAQQAVLRAMHKTTMF